MADQVAAPSVAPEVTSPAPVEGTSKPEGSKPQAIPSPQPPSKWKIKVDGKEEEVDLDTLKREYSKAKGADKRFEEAYKMRKQAEEFISTLKQDPKKILNDPRLGLNFKQLAEDYLKEQIEAEMLDPKERQLREYQRKLQEAENREKELKKQQDDARMQTLTQHYAEEYDRKIAEALRESGLPKSPRTVARMAALMERNLEYGYELEPKDLVQMVRNDYISEIKELFGSTDGDILLSILGDDVANKIRSSDLKRLKASMQPQSFQQPSTSKPSSKEEPGKKYISTYEWREALEKKFGK